MLEGKLTNDIMKIKLPKSTPILLVGPSAAGKSSFINSMLSVGVKRLSTPAQSSNAISNITSCTQILKSYNEDRLLKGLDIMDCIGLDANPKKGFNSEDFQLLLDGHIQQKYKFSEVSMPTSHSSYRENPSTEDKVHCVVLVIDINEISSGLPNPNKHVINTLRDAAKDADIPMMIILTKTDLFAGIGKSYAESIFRSSGVYRMVKKASELFDIDECDIHPVVNYRKQLEVNTDMNIVLLLAMRRIMENAFDHIKYELRNTKKNNKKNNFSDISNHL